VPLDGRKAAHILANRLKIQAGRSETVVTVSTSGGVTAYAAVTGAVFYDVNAVPSGVSTRQGDISRTSYDAFLELPSTWAAPAGRLVLIARTATATPGGVAAAERFHVLDRRRAGVAVTGSGGGANAGDRWVLRLRRIRN
jgi:hypothetical protein